MELKSGDIVSIAHYSEGTPFKSIVVDVNDDEVLLKLTKEFSIYNLFENDPIVLGFQAGNSIYVAESSISLINSKDSIVTIKVDNIEFVTDKRIYERFPVSLYADVKVVTIEGVGKRKIAFIRNISMEGLCMVSKDEFPEGEEICFDIYIDKRVLGLSGTVVWKKKESGNFQYGLKTVYPDFNTKNSLKLYLNILKDQQEKAIIHLKE